MTSLGFENYGEALKIYLARYREVSTLGGSPNCCRSPVANTDITRTLLPVASINAQASLARKEKQVPPMTALTTPPCSETPWTLLLKAQLTSPATQLLTSPSIRGVFCDPLRPQPWSDHVRTYLLFRCIYVAIGLPLKRKCLSTRPLSFGSWTSQAREHPRVHGNRKSSTWNKDSSLRPGRLIPAQCSPRTPRYSVRMIWSA